MKPILFAFAVLAVFEGSANAQFGSRGTNFANGEFSGNRQFAQSSNRLVQNRPIPNGFVEGPYGGFIESPVGGFIERPNGFNNGRSNGGFIERPNGAFIERPNGAIIENPNNFVQNGRLVAPNNGFQNNRVVAPNNFVQNGRIVAPNNFVQPGVVFNPNTGRVGEFVQPFRPVQTVQPVPGRMYFPN